ncbi:dTDP-4-dehydrorhamnose 3,5-epimerase family protein [Ekhidna sp.]|uniref:dTDP-4-dehydrorhamnose 3,5-epimerase family protein n=1 Tax=Ekhidna sp. TaxID=2608089 RepID=UPI0035193470
MRLIKQIGPAKVLELPVFKDTRGVFTKAFQAVDALHDFEVKQANLVENTSQGIFRGLHFQNSPYQERKFFRVLSGSIQLVFFDLEEEKGYDYVLDQTNHGVLIPRGFATGYLVLEKNTHVLYFSDNEYQSDYESGIRWDDERINCDWRSAISVVSEKDQNFN